MSRSKCKLLETSTRVVYFLLPGYDDITDYCNGVCLCVTIRELLSRFNSFVYGSLANDAEKGLMFA